VNTPQYYVVPTLPVLLIDNFILYTPVVIYILSSFYCSYVLIQPIPLAAPSKTCVYYRCLCGIAGSILARGMDVSLLWVLYVVSYRSLRRTDNSSRGVLSRWCLSTIKEPHSGELGPRGLLSHEKKKVYIYTLIQWD